MSLIFLYIRGRLEGWCELLVENSPMFITHNAKLFGETLGFTVRSHIIGWSDTLTGKVLGFTVRSHIIGWSDTLTSKVLGFTISSHIIGWSDTLLDINNIMRYSSSIK